jgi:hypothetical protein
MAGQTKRQRDEETKRGRDKETKRRRDKERLIEKSWKSSQPD